MKKLTLICLLAAAALRLSALEIYRPENHGELNDVPCLLRITDQDGNDASASIQSISFSWYYDMRNKDKWIHRYYDGCFTGGTIIHLRMKPGIYRISVRTPVERQGGYAEAGGADWQSNEFVYDTAAPALKVIFVSPTGDDNGFYSGGWHVSHRAPQFYRYTKPRRTEAE